MHLLAAVATQFVHTAEEMYRFIQSTFYAYQTDECTIKKEVDTAVEFLLENHLIEADVFQCLHVVWQQNIVVVHRSFISDSIKNRLGAI
jgi:replicative superfamily II helicase